MSVDALPLRDIKPLLPIPDLSFYMLLGVGVAAVTAVAALLVFGTKLWRMFRNQDPRFAWLERLERMDMNRPKETAYTMSRYGRLLAKEKRQKEIMAELEARLERYKYRQEVPPLDEETKRYIKLFIEMTRDAL